MVVETLEHAVMVEELLFLLAEYKYAYRSDLNVFSTSIEPCGSLTCISHRSLSSAVLSCKAGGCLQMVVLRPVLLHERLSITLQDKQHEPRSFASPPSAYFSKAVCDKIQLV